MIVLHRVGQFDIADGAFNLPDLTGHPFIALAARAHRPFHARVLAHLEFHSGLTLER